MVAKEMGLPWRAIEAIHWQMGAEEMASRANVPVFQPHTMAAGVRTKSPSGSKMNPNLAPAPTTPGGPGEREPNLQPTTRQRRSSSTTSLRRANSSRQKEPSLQFPAVFEAEPPPPLVLDPNQGSKSDTAVTPGSSAEWNGSPPMPAIPEEHLRPETSRRQSQSHGNQPPGSQQQDFQPQTRRSLPPGSQQALESPPRGNQPQSSQSPAHQQHVAQPPVHQSHVSQLQGHQSPGLEPIASDVSAPEEKG
jgi:hypothetical protein